MRPTHDFIGTGWAFPPAFDSRNLSAVMADGVQDIEESLRILLSTMPGERVMRPSYGCGLKRMVFENLETGVLTEMRDLVEQAVLFFEPRITLESLDFDHSQRADGVLRLLLGYTVLSTRTQHNWVYPLYVDASLWAAAADASDGGKP